MTTFELYKNLYKYKGIWGDMYGRSIKKEEDIIFIKQKDLKISKQADCFIFVWGFPGPDASFYYFRDYGKKWAFRKEDLLGLCKAYEKSIK